MSQENLEAIALGVAAAGALALVVAFPASSQAITAHAGSLWKNGQPFHPYGYNYGSSGWRWLTGAAPTTRGEPVPSLRYFDHPSKSRLRVMRRGMTQMKRHGANTVRVYIELGQVVRANGSVRKPTLKGLAKLLDVAERKHVYLDLTGNLMWRRPLWWYQALPQQERWAVEARFWRAVALVGSRSRAVLAYELTNEPVIIDGPVRQGCLAGYCFVRNIGEVAGRDSAAVMRSWVSRLRTAIDRVDRSHLVGLGMLPFTTGPIGPENLAPELDVLFVHWYGSEPEEGAEVVHEFAAPGKPVVLGESFAYWGGGDLSTNEAFLRQSAPELDGAMSFYLQHENRRDTAGILYHYALQQFTALHHQLF